MPTRTRIVIALTALTATAASFAGPRSARAQAFSAPTLQEAVAAAVRANADVALARLRVDSAAGERRIAGAIPPFALTSIPQVPWQYSIAAPLDIGPQRLFRTRAATEAQRAAEADALDMRREVTFAVRTAFADVLLAETARDVAREERGLLSQVLAADSARQRAGDVPAREVTKAELELARADAGLTRADGQVHAARLALQLLMGRSDPDTAVSVRGDLAFRAVTLPESLLVIAGERRPEVQAARERVSQSRALRELSAAQLLPVPMAAVVYQDGSPFANGSRVALGVGVQLPLLYWNSGERERSRAGLAAAEVIAQRTKVLVANDVLTAIDAYRQSRTLAERYQGGLVARAAAALETTRFAYQAGAASLLELIEAVRTDAAVRIDDAVARHDYWVAVYALSRATATELVP